MFPVPLLQGFPDSGGSPTDSRPLFKRPWPRLARSGLFRLRDEEHSVLPDYVPNGLFRGCNLAARKALRLGDFTVQWSRRSFKRSGRGYRTFFGPAFVHSGKVYARNDVNLGAAAFRQFHDKVGVQALRARQRATVTLLVASGWAHRVSCDKVYLGTEPKHFLERCEEAVEAPHPKRALRRATWAAMGDSGRRGAIGETHCKRVQLCQKPDEWGKPGKYARITCDLGTPASLRAGWLAEDLKTAMLNTRLCVGGGEIAFVKTGTPLSLGSAFKEMYANVRWFGHSDDAVVSLRRRDGGLVYFNLDISGCDSSQGEAVLWGLRACVPEGLREHFDCLAEQLRLPCRLGYGREAMIFRPVDCFEYSGSVLTTAMNTFASFASALHVLRAAPEFDTDDAAEQWLKDRLATSGWAWDVQRCRDFWDLQFLKHSPVRFESGELTAMLNLGVILRAFGQTRGDLPGSGDLFQRAVGFNSGLVRGFAPGGNHELYRVLKEKFCAEVDPISRYWYEGLKGETARISTASLLRRYRLSLSSWDDLIDAVRSSHVGDVVNCAASRVILHVDYSL